MFQYCLFDLDGTLTNPKEGITKSVQYALKAFGVEEPDLTKLEPFIGPPLQDSFMRFYGFTKEQAGEAIAVYRERFAPVGIRENRIYPGIEEMLMCLSEKGMKLAVASSKPECFVHQILEYFGIKKYFDVIVGSELDGRRTAKEEVVEEALRQLAVTEMSAEEKKKSCAMVGDRKFDIEGAIAHGLTGIGVRFGFAAQGELEKAGADFLADTVEELQEILLGRENER